MINNSKLLYFLSFMLMFTIGCEDEEVADNDSDDTPHIQISESGSSVDENKREDIQMRKSHSFGNAKIIKNPAGFRDKGGDKI